MKTDASNSHGKVFIVNNDIIEMWNEMFEIAYNVAKKVYSGELTLSEGKVEICNTSGISAASAQDYITDFLAMMSESEYHRTMSNYATSYFIKNTRNAFGEAAFLLAFKATEKYIKYYNSLGYGRLTAKENIFKKFREYI